jgi:hypothetical protein
MTLGIGAQHISSGDITFAGMACMGMKLDMAETDSGLRGLWVRDGIAGKVVD